VLPFVSFNAAQRVSNYQVQDVDIKRGYVDLPNAISIDIKTNVAERVPVIIEGGANCRILFKESGTELYSDSTFTVNTAGYRPNSLITKTYDSRIILPADTRKGTYPLVITMMPAI
jgi:hypothetical protein